MKFNNYEPTDGGFNINATSKFLDLLFKHYGRKARKILIKKGIIIPDDRIQMSVSYNLKFKIDRENENG